MAISQNSTDETNSVFIGEKILEGTKIFEALKMFQNAPTTFVTTNTTAAIPNTNADSVSIRREGF